MLGVAFEMRRSLDKVGVITSPAHRLPAHCKIVCVWAEYAPSLKMPDALRAPVLALMFRRGRMQSHWKFTMVFGVPNMRHR